MTRKTSRSSRLRMEVEAQTKISKVKMTICGCVPDLQDFDLTLGELKNKINTLMVLHGSNARLRTDAGHNNVSFELYYEADGDAFRKFLASQKSSE